MSKKDVEQQRYSKVVKSNSLIQNSRFSLSTQQQKIILFIISKLSSTSKDIEEYEFKVKEFCEVCGISLHSDIYDIIRKQIKDIADKSIWITLDNGDEALVRWIDRPKISKRSGTIIIQIDPTMKPYLLQLKEKFTEYELIYTLNLKSKYSIRLYEYLKSIHYNKLIPYTITIPIEQFQKTLDSNYAKFKDFHARALKPASEEINNFTDINFTYELITRGRTTTDIKITIETKDITDRVRTVKQLNETLDNPKEVKKDE